MTLRKQTNTVTAVILYYIVIPLANNRTVKLPLTIEGYFGPRSGTSTSLTIKCIINLTAKPSKYTLKVRYLVNHFRRRSLPSLYLVNGSALKLP